MSEVIIKDIDGIDVVQFQPRGVCAKMMQIRIKDDIIQDVEVIGGCAGNLSGIGNLVRGMNINDVIARLQGIPCGSRPAHDHCRKRSDQAESRTSRACPWCNHARRDRRSAASSCAR